MQPFVVRRNHTDVVLDDPLLQRLPALRLLLSRGRRNKAGAVNFLGRSLRGGGQVRGISAPLVREKAQRFLNSNKEPQDMHHAPCRVQGACFDRLLAF